MNREEAIERLKFHSGSHEDIENPRWQSGFLPSLRPYKGLNYAAYESLMQCLETLKPDIKDKETINAEIIQELWTICHYAKAWGADPQGMLRRNNLISEPDLEQLEEWINEVSYTVSCWLEGSEREEM